MSSWTPSPFPIMILTCGAIRLKKSPMSSKRNQPNAAINAVKAACCPRVPPTVADHVFDRSVRKLLSV